MAPHGGWHRPTPAVCEKNACTRFSERVAHHHARIGCSPVFSSLRKFSLFPFPSLSNTTHNTNQPMQTALTRRGEWLSHALPREREQAPGRRGRGGMGRGERTSRRRRPPFWWNSPTVPPASPVLPSQPLADLTTGTRASSRAWSIAWPCSDYILMPWGAALGAGAASMLALLGRGLGLLSAARKLTHTHTRSSPPPRQAWRPCPRPARPAALGELQF